MEVGQLSGATEMYEKLKSIFKQTPEFLIVHISTNDTSKYTPNKIVDTC